MPSDIVSLAVSTGFGVSILAGIVSGVCYILAHRIQNKRNRKPGREWYCEICGTYLRSIDGILEGDKVVTCEKCGKRVCKIRCSNLNKKFGWTCKNCSEPKESWISALLNIVQFQDLGADYKMNLDSEETTNRLRKNEVEREKVRDFIEKLVTSILGDNVDDANVSKMYNDKQYLPSSEYSPSTAHVVLKNLIERLLEESSSFPEFRRLRHASNDSLDQTDRSYEDLLATAIINKVISTTQNRLPTSSGASVSSRISTRSRNRDDKEYFFGKETLDNKWKTTDVETTSVSSLEDWLYSDSSFGSKKFVDKETFTIKQLIEEVSQSEDSEDDDDFVSSKRSVFDEDEPNWFLQKRQFQGTNSPVPVPMLVPKPTTEAKVLIGDKEIDETSDLSDVASDFGENEIIPTRQTLLIESKTLIGGKNRRNQTGSDGESSADSGVKELRDKSGYDDPIGEEIEESFIVKADITVDDDNVEDASILSIYSHTEKEAEYTEKYASLPRTIAKSPTPQMRTSLYKSKLEIEKTETTDEEDSPKKLTKFSGSYSKREKEKWKHAVEMKNNPYSKENIEKRIKRSNHGHSIFGPDYYAKLASSPSGGKLKISETRDLAWPPSKTYEELTENEDVTHPEEEEEVEVFENNNNIVPRLNEKNESHQIQPSEFTSDSDLSFVNFYDVEKSRVYKKTKEELLEENPEYKDENSNVFNQNGREKEKPKYVKAKYTAPTNLAKINKNNLRRHKSESDLLEESFDSPPRILARKKDNTLIEKIYQHANVRNFALNSRNQVPVETPKYTSQRSFHEIPINTFSAQKSLNEPSIESGFNETARYNGKITLYNSDDGLELNQTVPAKESNHSEKIRNNSMSSEDDILSERSIKRTNSRHLIYSSSEDLLSIEEIERPQKKKDNTLIEKIYQNANVRNFALNNREYILPIPEPRKKMHNLEEQVFEKPLVPETKKQTSQYDQTAITHTYSQINDNSDDKPAVVINSYADKVRIEISSPVSDRERNVVSPDPEIDEIAKRKIVHQVLEQITESKPKVAVRTKLFTNQEREENSNEEEELGVSVKELRKMFETNETKNMVNSSLTGRSLSNQVKETLRN